MFQVIWDYVHCQDPLRALGEHDLLPGTSLHCQLLQHLSTQLPQCSHKHLCSLLCSVHLMYRTITWRPPCCLSLDGLHPLNPDTPKCRALPGTLHSFAQVSRDEWLLTHNPANGKSHGQCWLLLRATGANQLPWKSGPPCPRLSQDCPLPSGRLQRSQEAERPASSSSRLWFSRNS